MAWIESHQELARHPKTRKLARTLGISIPTAIGHLHLLWWWAMDYAQNGSLERYDADDIADAAMWDGDASEFIEAMCAAGFIDRDQNGILSIHDWEEYAGRLLEKRRADAERKRTMRQRPVDVQWTSDGCPPDGAGNLTIPNHTLPNQTKDSPVSSNELTGPDGDSAAGVASDPPSTQISDNSEPTNRELIGELISTYRKVVPEKKHSKGDPAFIGRLYNDFGYDKVLCAINELSYRIAGGFVPDKPLVYLKAIIQRTPDPRASPKRKKFIKTGKYSDIYQN